MFFVLSVCSCFVLGFVIVCCGFFDVFISVNHAAFLPAPCIGFMGMLYNYIQFTMSPALDCSGSMLKFIYHVLLVCPVDGPMMCHGEVGMGSGFLFIRR